MQTFWVSVHLCPTTGRASRNWTTETAGSTKDASKRDPDHIKKLWNVLADALAYADNESNRSKFVESFDTVIALGTSIGMLTIGLFWIRPYKFLPFGL